MRFKRYLFDKDVMRLMSYTLVTKPIALVTQVLTASYFGAGAQLDAFAFALFPVRSIEETLGRVFTSVSIPQLTRLRDSKEPYEVQQYQNSLILLFGIPVTVIILALLFWSNQFVDLVGYQLPEETKLYAYKMIKVLAIPGLMLYYVTVFSALLNLNRHYQIPALMLLLNATISLACMILLQDRMGIWCLPAGFAISYLIQTPLIIIRAIQTRAFTFARPAVARADLGLLWSMSWMILVSQILLMINSFVDKWFAAGLEVGSISSINYSMNLMNFGQQIFTLSIVVVMFTQMSALFSAGQMNKCNNYIETNTRKVSTLVVPVSLALFLICPELVRVLFQHGAFDQADSLRTSGALGMYLLGLPALVINGMVTKIFQSLQRQREKVYLALQYLITNIIGNMILVKSLGVAGLAISSSIAINLHLILSLWVLHSYRVGLRTDRFIQIIALTYLMAFIAWAAFSLGGVGRVLDGLIPGQSRWAIMALGAAKFSAVILLYGVQVVVWRALSRRKTN